MKKNIKYAIIAFFIVLILSLGMSFIDKTKRPSSITGMATGSGSGCCERFCEETTKQKCYEGVFHDATSCDKIDKCNIGCCIDKEGYCLSNYLMSNCEAYGYKFIKKECPEVPKCVIPTPSFLVRQDTGIRVNVDASIQDVFEGASGARLDNGNMVFDPDDPYGLRYVLVEPIAGAKGTLFYIKYVIDEPSEISDVEITLKDNNSTAATLALYDDGNHDDANNEDGIYGNKWDSSSLTGASGLRKISIDAAIVKKDGTINLKERISSFVVSINSNCIPLTMWDSSKKRDIIFLGNQYKRKWGVDRLKIDVNNNFNNFAVISPFREKFDQVNYYIIEEDFTLGSDALSAIKSECKFFDKAEDLAIIFDYSEKKCRRFSTSEGNIFTLSPETVYFFDSPFTLNEAIFDVCNVANTFEEYNDRKKKEEADLIPKIDLKVKDGQWFWQNEFDIKFIIKYNYSPAVDYQVYINGGKGIEGTAASGKLTEERITLDNGDYNMYIEAKGDFVDGVSDAVDFHVDGTVNFGIDITSPNKGDITSTNEIEVRFTVSHFEAKNVNYGVFVDNVEKGSGEAVVGAENVIHLKNLEQGSHSLFIEATDDKGRKASSNDANFVVT